jgi:murein DD-endopeptidase MepM/ murein hydrolase activator NlpD
MPSHARSYKRAVGAALATLGASLGVALSGSQPVARAASIGGLQQQINAGQGNVSSLSGAFGAASGRVSQLDSAISGLEQRLATIQANLDAQRAALARLRVQYAAAKRRLEQLVAFDAHAENVLSQLLVQSYESDHPDLVSVVLDATGFQNLLERLAFAQRIRTQDVTVIREVKAARRAVAFQATRLGALQVREQKLTAKILSERDTLARVKVKLYTQEIAAAQVKASAGSRLASARAHLSSLKSQLSQLEAAQTRTAISSANPSSSVGSPSVSFAPISSSGGFVFPMPKGSASGPGSWSLDNGVDISAPGGTPELAVCSGTIVLHGIGGFGQWAPVLHCDSPVGGYSYVYYGHAGPANQLPVGTHVGAGQVMSEVGPGIVGISTGPHLEIGFCDASGSLLGPGTAGTMESLLQSAYGA